jgi:hypothetical protein
LSACWYKVSLPWAMRGCQSALSPGFGAPVTPAAWHTAQVLVYTVCPLPAAPIALVLLALVSVPAGAALVLEEASALVVVDGAALVVVDGAALVLEEASALVVPDGAAAVPAGAVAVVLP